MSITPKSIVIGGVKLFVGDVFRVLESKGLLCVDNAYRIRDIFGSNSFWVYDDIKIYEMQNYKVERMLSPGYYVVNDISLFTFNTSSGVHTIKDYDLEFVKDYGVHIHSVSRRIPIEKENNMRVTDLAVGEKFKVLESNGGASLKVGKTYTLKNFINATDFRVEETTRIANAKLYTIEREGNMLQIPMSDENATLIQILLGNMTQGDKAKLWDRANAVYTIDSGLKLLRIFNEARGTEKLPESWNTFSVGAYDYKITNGMLWSSKGNAWVSIEKLIPILESAMLRTACVGSIYYYDQPSIKIAKGHWNIQVHETGDPLNIGCDPTYSFGEIDTLLRKCK